MKEIIEVLKSFNPKQWAAMIAIVGICIGAYSWIETRYARQESADMILENLISIDSKLSAIITTQFNKEQIEKIQESAELYEKHMRRYRDEKKEK